MSVINGFDWDDGNREKCTKHGVPLAKVEAVFTRPHRVAPDLAHSGAETRFLAIGRGDGRRPIFVAFTLRQEGGETLIRPISARYMHRKEVDRYEQGTAALDH